MQIRDLDCDNIAGTQQHDDTVTSRSFVSCCDCRRLCQDGLYSDAQARVITPDDVDVEVRDCVLIHVRESNILVIRSRGSMLRTIVLFETLKGREIIKRLRYSRKGASSILRLWIYR